MIVLLCQLLLPYIHPVLRWVPLLEKGGEPHRMVTGQNSLNSTIQSPIAGEEIGEGALYWIERCTLLVALALTLLCVSAELKGKSPPIPSLNFFFWVLSTASKARIGESVRDISAFHPHNRDTSWCLVGLPKTSKH